MQVQVIKIKPTPKSEVKFDRRDVFSHKFDYEVFYYAMCVNCAYFSFENTKENIEWGGKYSCGKCRLAKAMGAYEGVLSTAVCNKYLSHQGTNINQKTVTLKQLPDFVNMVKDEKGKYHVTLTK